MPTPGIFDVNSDLKFKKKLFSFVENIKYHLGDQTKFYAGFSTLCQREFFSTSHGNFFKDKY